MTINARFVMPTSSPRTGRDSFRSTSEFSGARQCPPERELAGQWLEDGTGVPDAQIRGVHLRLPGYGDEGPTLEIFQYNFAVDDVEAVRDALIAAGGGAVGELVSVEIPGAGTVTFVYMTDPEGNIIELQRWL